MLEKCELSRWPRSYLDPIMFKNRTLHLFSTTSPSSERSGPEQTHQNQTGTYPIFPALPSPAAANPTLTNRGRRRSIPSSFASSPLLRTHSTRFSPPSSLLLPPPTLTPPCILPVEDKDGGAADVAIPDKDSADFCESSPNRSSSVSVSL